MHPYLTDPESQGISGSVMASGSTRSGHRLHCRQVCPLHSWRLCPHWFESHPHPYLRI